MIYSKGEKISCIKCKIEIEELHKKKLVKEDYLKVLKHPFRVVKVNFPIKKDTGEIEIIKGYRVLYNNTLGPGKGGIRFHPSVTEEETVELSYIMTLKTSLVNLPFGGAKGGVEVDLKDYSESEIEKISRGYVRALFEVLGPQKDIPAPDVGTNPKIMDYMRDEYEKLIGSPSPAFITGKPVEKGGSLGRDTATAMGGFYILQELFKDKNTKIAIQGFGNVGAHMARLAYEAGYKVVAISDVTGAFYDENGIDIEEVFENSYKLSKPLSSFEGIKKYKQISNEELLLLDVDVLIPAALGGVISLEVAEKLKAKNIIELANAPILPNAEKLLIEKGVNIIPDLLANSGGVIVSYFEWLQNIENKHWSLQEVNTKLKEKILKALYKVLTKSKETSTSLRQAAYLIAINRIGKELEKTL